MGRMLTDSEAEALPEEIRGWYRTHDGLRSLDDLVWFPPAKRESLERVAARGQAKAVERIRRLEGDEAADEAAEGIEAERRGRAQLLADVERQAS